jgi:hypothetical protein
MNYKQDKPRLRLMQSADKDYFLDCIDELYTTIEKDPGKFQVTRQVVTGGRIKSFLVRKLSAFPWLLQAKTRLGKSETINFASMISGDFRLMIPVCFFSRQNYIYMYDVWPRFHHWIFPMFRFFNISQVFFSSKQVYEEYTRKYPSGPCRAMWLPEALDGTAYQFKPHTQRTVDVLEFGRNYDHYHNLIVAPLQENNYKHLYKTPDTPVLFPGKSAFTAALSDSRIVICVPSNISHPERAEYISTMTLRYLQAMASKCLVVGILPSDMEAAFGYIPIIEIELERAGEQLTEILANYDQYLPLIEKNYNEVMEKHQWSNRWKVIQQKMEENR